MHWMTWKNVDKRGSGLGLAMSKKIVEAPHGTISVDSTPGVGTIFSIRFPLSKSIKN